MTFQINVNLEGMSWRDGCLKPTIVAEKTRQKHIEGFLTEKSSDTYFTNIQNQLNCMNVNSESDILESSHMTSSSSVHV